MLFIHNSKLTKNPVYFPSILLNIVKSRAIVHFVGPLWIPVTDGRCGHQVTMVTSRSLDYLELTVSGTGTLRLSHLIDEVTEAMKLT